MLTMRLVRLQTDKTYAPYTYTTPFIDTPDLNNFIYILLRPLNQTTFLFPDGQDLCVLSVPDGQDLCVLSVPDGQDLCVLSV